MLLTCPNCRNSYVVDDQLYAQQGAVCEQCKQPLVPADNGGYGQQQQWGQQQAQWGQQQAQWGQQQAQWGQQQQWGQQPPSPPQWGQQPAQQWGQQQAQNAQWGQQPPSPPQWGQQSQEIQWGQQPPGADWGQQQQQSQWDGQGASEIQWGQQPQGSSQWGDQAQWSQMADKPETGAPPLPAIPSLKQGNSERTMALDLDDDWQNALNKAVDEAGGPAGQPSPAPNPSASSISQIPGGSLVIGTPAGKNDEVTHEVNIQQIQKIYGDKLNPIKEFFFQIPQKYLIIIGASFGGFIILFIIIAIVVTRPPEVETVITKHGDIVEAGTEVPKIFEDIVEETKDLSSLFPPFEGEKVTKGSLVGVGRDIGVVYHGKHIADIGDVSSGPAFVEKLNEVVNKDMVNAGQPIVILFDETLAMNQVYRTMYSFAPSGRKVLFGGTAPTGIVSMEITPCAWPDHGLFAFYKCEKAQTEVKITKQSITMSRIRKENDDDAPEPEPLLIDPDDETPVWELQDDIIGGKVQFVNIAPALAKMRTSGTGYVLLKPDQDVSFDVFLHVALDLYGSLDNPNIKALYLAPVLE